MRRLIISALDVFSLYRASRGGDSPNDRPNRLWPKTKSSLPLKPDQQQNDSQEHAIDRGNTTDSTCQRGSHRYRDGPDIVRGSRQGC